MKKELKELNNKLESIVKNIENTLDTALRLECTDPIRMECAITLATRLRVLLNDENKNKSLVSLLKIKNQLRFQGTKHDVLDVMPSNLVFTSALTSVNITNKTIYCKANAFTPDKRFFILLTHGGTKSLLILNIKN